MQELSKQEEMVVFLRKQLILYQVVALAVFVIGFGAMLWGFWQWYDKLQRHLDRQVAAPVTCDKSSPSQRSLCMASASGLRGYAPP
jgi:hypothetical protein